MASRAGKPYARRSPSGAMPDGQWLHDKAPGSERIRPPRVSEPTVSNTPSAKLLIDNLHYEVSEKDLASLFGKYGSFAREPRIRFDKSGRSTGSAVVVFTELDDAKAAKRALDKQLAKGQEIQVRFDSTPTGPRGGAKSLLARLDKGEGSLASRLSESSSISNVPTGPRGQSGLGPHRTRGRGGGGRGGGGGVARDRPGPKKPLTAEDLDKQLDQYGAQSLGDDAPQDGPAAVQAEAPAAAASGDVDVEMAT